MAEPDAIPDLHPLENPVVWLVLQVAELVLATVVLRALLPAAWLFPLRLLIWAVVIVALTIGNYAIRRRFIPR